MLIFFPPSLEEILCGKMANGWCLGGCWKSFYQSFQVWNEEAEE